MKFVGLLLCLLGLVGCAEEPDPVGCAEQTDAPYIEIVAPKITIQPGDDKTFCFTTTYHGPDIGIERLETIQSKGGHHAFIMKSILPADVPEDLMDCSHASTLPGLTPLVLPDLPLGKEYAIPLKSGTPLVFHFHYINASPDPFVVQDIARLYTVNPSEVKHWMGTFAMADVGFALDPHESTLRFDYELPRDLVLLVAGGHMHELGDSFFLTYQETASDPPETLYSVDPWLPEYRDDPPIQRLSRSLTKSSVLSVRCTWKPRNIPTGFPEEMCAAFGYVEEPSALEGVFPTEATGFLHLVHGEIQ